MIEIQCIVCKLGSQFLPIFYEFHTLESTITIISYFKACIIFYLYFVRISLSIDEICCETHQQCNV